MRNIVCIGATAGGLAALEQLLRRIPSDLPAAIFIVRHIGSDGSGLLPEVLQPVSALPLANAVDGEPIENGRVYLAPPNRHLVLDRKSVMLVSGPKENWARPAIDPLFRSDAQHHGSRSIDIVLSGKLDDGTAGLWALKGRGGMTVVQTPGTADSPDMPNHAVAAVDVDVVADAEEIGTLLPRWCRETTGYAVSDLTERVVELENAYLVHREGPECTQRNWLRRGHRLPRLRRAALADAMARKPPQRQSRGQVIFRRADTVTARELRSIQGVGDLRMFNVHRSCYTAWVNAFGINLVGRCSEERA
ncbi:MAG: chemotaxis protein CheB [Opitutus sp.]